ncbi:GNAT family N-acetyltransferase [Specibacter sp. RAF43]|uniref:GNAT family N-acetyltransferase n=1 Tax=Specibacter sp. RAF43 TaxID=3233057 RepID=UPI003F985A16
MELSSERLVLREFTEADFDAVHAFASDPRTSIFVEWGPNTRRDTGDFLDFCAKTARAIPRTGYTLAVTVAAGPPIGSIGLTLGAGNQADIGYVLGHECWGHGYATEAARAMLTFGFSTLRLGRITATCRPENTASAGVLRKLGMQQVGHRKNDRLIRGTWLDSLVFAIDAADCPPARSRQDPTTPRVHGSFTPSGHDCGVSHLKNLEES